MTSQPFFKMAVGSHIGFELSNVRSATKSIVGLSLILKSTLDRTCSF